MFYFILFQKNLFYESMLPKFIQYRRSRKAASPNRSELEEKVKKAFIKVAGSLCHFLAAQTQ